MDKVPFAFIRLQYSFFRHIHISSDNLLRVNRI